MTSMNLEPKHVDHHRLQAFPFPDPRRGDVAHLHHHHTSPPGLPRCVGAPLSWPWGGWLEKCSCP